MESNGSARRNRRDSADNTDITTAEIDDSLYSRQRYVLGEDAMQKLRKGKVAIFGLSGVGVETAKNLILGGCGHVSIWDPSEVSRFDLSQSYCFAETDVGQSRLSVAIPKLQELNPGCKVDELRTTEFDNVFMEQLRTTYDCVVVNGLDISIERRMFINDFLRGELTSTSITSSPQSQSAATGVTGGSGRLAAFSRQQSQQRTVQKAFISADVFGVLGHVFVDLGNEFIVKDPGNTDKREIFFSSITDDAPSTVTTVDRCSLTKGDFVTLHGVSAAAVPEAARWNNQRFAIVAARDIKHPAEPSKTITQLELSNFEPFPAGIEATAYFRQSPKPLKVRYRPLRAQLTSPTIRPCEFVNPHAHVEDHIAWVALMTYNKRYGRWPEPWDREDCGRLATLAREQSQAFGIEPQIDRMFMKLTACTCKAQLAPLAGFIGGFAAQEAMKAITAKFVPLQQFLYVDFRDLVPKNAPVPSFRPKGDRYDGTRLILGDGALKKIFNFQAFLVGAGAIGCEWLKNLALVGFGTNAAAGGGCITVTDDDHIEKSNLNRQFLFRPQHINKPKSTTAAEQVQKHINPGMQIKAYQKRVQPANAEHQQDEQDAVFNDDFLSQQSAVLFALDNRNTRLYLAQRCCANNVAHFDSGTLGEYGHTFSVLPYLTEKYDNVRDPSESDDAGGSAIPYCTMKQFPYKIDHCIEWARDKFHTLWSEKPTIALRCLEKLTSSNNSATVGALLDAVKNAGSNPFEGSVVLRQLLSRKFTAAEDCVLGARDKFYKYFELKARRLLRAFPPEHVNEDGTAFWAAPKRAPEPVVFDAANAIHRLFIMSFARLLANEHNVPISHAMSKKNADADASDSDAENATIKNKNLASKQCFTWDFCQKVLAGYVIKEEDDDANKQQKNGDATHVEGSDDEEISMPTTEKAASSKKHSSSSKDNQVLIYILESGLESGRWQRDTPLHFNVQQFEKDDDSNGHIDFIYATTNSRAQMYRIEQEDYFSVKRIAGRITPAIATTTACVAGLACLELLRFVHEQAKINESLLSKSAEESGAILKNFRNAQLNLGDASLLLFEPNAAPRRKIFAGLEVNSWDTWRVVEPTAAADTSSSASFTIDYVSAQLKQKYNVDLVSMIQGTRIIWMKDFPQFDSNELRSKTDLGRVVQFSDKGYADVSIDCERPGEEDDGGGNPHNMPPEFPLLRLEKASAAGAAAAAAAALKSAASTAGGGGAPSSSRPASRASATGGGSGVRSSTS